MAKSNKNKSTEAKVASVEATELTTSDKVEQVEEQKQADAEASADTSFDHVVVQRFYDKNDESKPADERRYYEVGDTVNQFGEARLNDLVSRRLVTRKAK